MTTEIPFTDIAHEIWQAIHWVRSKYNIPSNQITSPELKKEFGLHWCMDQYGLVYAVQFDTEAQYTWFMLRWSQ
jgi:hypothetical protein